MFFNHLCVYTEKGSTNIDPVERSPKDKTSPQASPAAHPRSRSSASNSSDSSSSGSSSSDEEDENNGAMKKMRSSVAQIKVNTNRSTVNLNVNYAFGLTIRFKHEC